MNATAMQMSNSYAMRKIRHPMSLRVALLAQRQIKQDEAAATDVMVYHQPASDVPVPADWRPSKSVPPDPLESGERGDDSDADKSYDEDMVGWESAGVSIHRLEQLEHHSASRRIAANRGFATGTRVSLLLLGSALTCTLFGWVALI